MIDWTKPIQTTENRSVTVLSTNGPGDRPYVCILDNGYPEGILARFPQDGVGGSFTLQNVPDRLDLTKPMENASGLQTVTVLRHPYQNASDMALVLFTRKSDGFEIAHTIDVTTGYINGKLCINDTKVVNTPSTPTANYFWVNVYHGGNPQIHETRERADRLASGGRQARVKVTYTEGQFDA